MRKPLVVSWIAVLLGCGLVSCTWFGSPRGKVEKERAEVRDAFLGEYQRQKSGAGRGSLSATWPDALEKMYLRSPRLIQADNVVENAKRRQGQVWRRMIPGFGAGFSDSFEIGSLADAFSSPTLRINSYLSLGNLLTLPKEVYTNKLTYMGAELQAESSMRQEVIALYRTFQQQRLLKLEKRALDLEGQMISSITGLEGGEVMEMKMKHLEAVENWQKNVKSWREKVGDFFMESYDAIDLLDKQLPDISYRPSELDFADTGRWGLLQLNLLALEQIAEEGQIAEAYFRYLPRANFSVSAPPLYNNNSSGQSFDLEGIGLGPSLNWNLDTDGSIGQQIDRLKGDKTIKDWRKDKRRTQEIEKLLEGKQALIEVQQELGKIRSAMEGYKGAVLNKLVTDSEMAVRTMRQLREREVRLMAREVEISTSFWLIDEQRWSSITKRWHETRKIRAKERKTRKDS